MFLVQVTTMLEFGSLKRNGVFLRSAILNCLIILLLVSDGGIVKGEYVREFEVSENVPVGSLIGHIGGQGSDSSNNQAQGVGGNPPSPPYLIVPVPGSAVDSDLDIDQSSGEIRTKIVLDRETKGYYSFVAIPLSGENVRVVINVLDENDNAPHFPNSHMDIEFPENSPRDSKRTLNPGRDRDVGLNNVQQYRIVSGNTNNAFRLSSHRERDNVLYLDLQVNGFLDRETTPFYHLVIEACDGGVPSLKGTMGVNITILDVNDNQPLFNQSRYSAQVPENATVGTAVLKLFATDADSGVNGEVSYSINRRQSDRDNYFVVDPKTGVISVNKPLDFESKDVHELVLVARDNGAQPLETTSFVTVRVVDVNDNQPTISLIFLRDDTSPKISEDAQPGEFVARISVNDPDSKTEYANANVTLEGGDGHFGLTTRDNIIYLVFVNKPLDREEQANYTLIVTATDLGNPPLQVSTTFDLVVTDVNDNAPQFEQKMYQASVPEVADPGTSVLHITAVDKDEGNNSIVTYSLKHDPDSSQWFQINPKTGLITTRSHVDCETNPSPKVTVIATDHGIPSLSSSTIVTITILDVNDNEPIFDQSFYNVSVVENEAVGKCILKVSATDADCGVNGKVNYTLGQADSGKIDGGEFFMNPVSGELCTKGPLDHEKRAIYEFSVIAMDRGNLRTTAMAKIQVIDVNDNRPVFYPRQYNVSLKEQVVISTPVVTVVATDADSDKFGSVTYRIVSGNDQGLFRIDSTSGDVFLKKPLSKEIPIHHLIVSAVDGAGLASEVSAQVWVSVIDPNQQPPIFDQTKYSFSIEEGSGGAGTVVGMVRAVCAASDKDEVRYSIVSGDPDGYFNIEPLKGVLTTTTELDHELHSSLLLNVQAVSGQPPTYGHTQVVITIDDINDNVPMFDSTDAKISVPENADLNSAIYAAHATDPDSKINGKVTYELLRNPKDTFVIGSNSGYVTLKRPLDYEMQQRFNLIVGVTDAGKPKLRSNMSLTVEVQDINDNPPLFERSDYVVNVQESLAINKQFAQLTATDRDTGNNARLTYLLKENNPNNNFSNVFGIFPNSGALYLKEALDRETRDSYQVMVVARDNGSPSLSATCSVKINVLDVNDNAPSFLSKGGYAFHVRENAEKGLVVGSVTAADRDTGNNATLRYTFEPAENTIFQLDKVSGRITTKMTLDREQKEVYDLIVKVSDAGNPPLHDSVNVKVYVDDVNDNPPVFVEPKKDIVSVREEQAVGTEVIQIIAVDNDKGPNGTVTYSLIRDGDALDSDAFEIHSSKGVLSTAITLDHEHKSLYKIAILAKDNGNPSLQEVRILQIEVLDLNDNRPTFSSASITLKVAENVGLGMEVGKVSAEDADGRDNSGHVIYSIIGGNRLHVFEINRTTGALYVVAPIDYESAPVHVLQVKAVDTLALEPHGSVVNVTVEIQDLNDNIPMFPVDPVVFSVSEARIPSTGGAVYHFTAIDRDRGVGGELRYALSELNDIDETSAWELDSLTGSLTVGNLDHEKRSEYIFVVTATDGAGSGWSSSVTAKLIVEDVNDNSPVFVSRNRVLVPEDLAKGHPVLTVVALDEDSGENGRVDYKIVSGNAENQFRLNSTTGVLSLARLLDRETDSNYILNISASDNGHPTSITAFQMINITVEDVNDNDPVFDSIVYTANVTENTPGGVLVMKVRATDKDLGANGNLTYLLPEGLAGDKFEVDPIRGEIRTVAALDREERHVHYLTVYVRDGAFPARYSTATVIVHVNDVNDNAPVFHDSCYPLHVPENSDLAVIHSVVASDLDSGPNGDVTYSIADGNVGSKFSLDLHSGQLTVAPLDREAISHYYLTIIARDDGDPSRSAVCNISVTVDDQNDNDPRFSQDVYALTIPEDVLMNTTILTLSANDADAGNNAEITYSLSNETQWLFKIDSHSGVITTAGMFDREKRGTYSFEVRATDGGKYDARSEKALVQVSIGDVNDNKPIFSKYPYTVEIPSKVQPGSRIIQVSAADLDEGPNAEIVYSFANSELADKFRINSDNGVVTAVGNLEPDLEVYNLVILAVDRGKPAQTSTGMIQILVGDHSHNAQLTFSNSSYVVDVSENLSNSRELIQMSATRTDGKRVGVTYGFSSGNEDAIFEISPTTGVVHVRDPRKLDYEVTPKLRLIVSAQSDGPYPLHAYSTLWINVLDRNDNPPRFTQDHYVAAVWEGNNKGTFVVQVSATDDDQGLNANIVYHIVDGNYDNAFVIEPPFSGIVKTNIVLDREIREFYKLTIVAMDEGAPQLTGTCTLGINIIDVNDNQPTFPPQNVVSISEASNIGTTVTAITANDVDTHPSLMYSFAQGGNPGEHFSIDRYSGKITLAKQLDHEEKNQRSLRIQVSDTAHVVDTTLTVNVIDVNDNAPTFTQQFYQVTLGRVVEYSKPVVQINASDPDAGEHGRIRYSLKSNVGVNGDFFINEYNGAIFMNKSRVNTANGLQTVQMLVLAEDHGRPPLSSVAVVHIQMADASVRLPMFPQKFYFAKVSETASIGEVVLKLSAGQAMKKSDDNQFVYTLFSSSDSGRLFDIDSHTGDVFLTGFIDRERHKEHNVTVTAYARGTPYINASTTLIITVEDVNDNTPQFKAEITLPVNVSEATPVGSEIVLASALDVDLNGDISYDITSGNEAGHFAIDSKTGSVVLKKALDYENATEHRLVVRAKNVIQGSKRHLESIVSVQVNVQDENDNSPQFPLLNYWEFVEENSPAGTPVYTVRAFDADEGIYGKLRYSFSVQDGDDDEIKNSFRIDENTGSLVTNAVFDYETRHSYNLIITAEDAGGQKASVKLRVDVESRDEYAPAFTGVYKFAIPGNAPVGYVVGRVEAKDRDRGVDGRVIYTLRNSHPNFKINRTSGEIIVKSAFRVPDGLAHQQQQLTAAQQLRSRRDASLTKDVSLVISATSGRPNSLSNVTVAEILVDFLNGVPLNIGGKSADGASSSTASSGGMAGWTLGLVVSLAILAVALFSVIVFLRYRNQHRRSVKSGMAREFDNSFDVIDIHQSASGTVVVGSSSQYPPGYDDIGHYSTPDGGGSVVGGSSTSGGHHVHRSNTTSEISEQSQSASSGRGSAEEENEDVEDEEIRMINEGPLLRDRLGGPDSGIQPDNEMDHDNVSESSVHNTQEYLARLGIGTTARSDTTSNKSPHHRPPDFEKILRHQPSQQPRHHQFAQQQQRPLHHHHHHHHQPQTHLLHHHQPHPQQRHSVENIRNIFGEEEDDSGDNGSADISSLIYAKINNDDSVTTVSVVGGGGDGSSSTRSSYGAGGGGPTSTVGEVTNGGGGGASNGGGGFGDESQLSMTGSLSSIVHSEEELAGSYNWDYLLDWGPQYQPLAHVFAEIARLKDDTVNIAYNSGNMNGDNCSTASQPQKTLNPQVLRTHLPPPLITNVAPRSIAPVALSSTRTSQLAVSSLPTLPKSPIGHEASFLSSAMSPSFSPSLSPLATRSPSISPLVTPGSAMVGGLNLPPNTLSVRRPKMQLPSTSLAVQNVINEQGGELRI